MSILHTVERSIQTDDAAMKSPLRPVLADRFMIELEKILPPDIYISVHKILEEVCRQYSILC